MSVKLLIVSLNQLINYVMSDRCSVNLYYMFLF